MFFCFFETLRQRLCSVLTLSVRDTNIFCTWALWCDTVQAPAGPLRLKEANFLIETAWSHRASEFHQFGSHLNSNLELCWANTHLISIVNRWSSEPSMVIHTAVLPYDIHWGIDLFFLNRAILIFLQNTSMRDSRSAACDHMMSGRQKTDYCSL